MTGYRFTKIKYLFGFILFSSTLLINLSFVHASYTASEVVTLTNSARSENGLGSLATNSKLASAAYAKAQDILEKDYFAHNSPDGKTPWDFINESGYTYSYAGENLAIGYTDASELFTAWMNSPTHRDNIVNKNFREIGIAVVSGDYQGAQTVVAVQEFGTPNGTIATENEQVASATPTPVTEANATPEATALSNESNNQNLAFKFIADKSNISPASIFVGEEATIAVTISGEVKTLEASVFDTKINLLDTSNISGTTEKTYSIKQKINQEGTGEVRVVGTDKNGNSGALSLGNLEAKATVITKGETEQNIGTIAKIKSSIIDYWFIYLTVLVVLISILVINKVTNRTKFNELLTSWRL